MLISMILAAALLGAIAVFAQGESPDVAAEDAIVGHFSIIEGKKTHAIRFVFEVKGEIAAHSLDIAVSFLDANGNAVKSYLTKLGGIDGDYTLYTAFAASGEEYPVRDGSLYFGFSVVDIPNGAWNEVTVTATDPETDVAYMARSGVSAADMTVDLGFLPDYSSLGGKLAPYNAGPGLASDKEDKTEEDSYVQIIAKTTAERLEAYTKVLEASGFKVISKTTLDGDVYYTYQNFGRLFYLYHNARIAETRIILDQSSVPLSEIEVDYTPRAGDVTAFYQYSLNYDNADKAGYDPIRYSENKSINCGMLYILKLADNSVVVVDGGHEKQSTVRSRAGLMKFLREITGVGENGKVRIASWFFSHAHGDHVRLAADFLDEYHQSVDLISVLYNFPSYQVLSGGYDGNTFTLKDVIREHFPDVLYHKLHTGEVFTMAGVTLEVVYTHEDATKPSGKSEIGDFNSTSTVLKLTMEGETIMLLGDISGVAEDVIMAMHSSEYLKADAVQVSHHGFNSLPDLYKAIDARIALFSQSAYTLKDRNDSHGNLKEYQQVMKYAEEEYFAHKYTYEFTVQNGKLVARALDRYDA